MTYDHTRLPPASHKCPQCGGPMSPLEVYVSGICCNCIKAQAATLKT